MKYLCVLGGTGFSEKSPRIRMALGFLFNHPHYQVITSGLGVEEVSNGKFERDFVADLLAERGYYLSRERIVIGKSGDPEHRGHRDDILQVLNAVDWELEKCPEFLAKCFWWLLTSRRK